MRYVPAASTPSLAVAAPLYIHHDSKLPISALVDVGLWLKMLAVVVASTAELVSVVHLCIRLLRSAVAGLGVEMKCVETVFVPVVGRLIAAEQLCIRPWWVG